MQLYELAGFRCKNDVSRKALAALRNKLPTIHSKISHDPYSQGPHQHHPPYKTRQWTKLKTNLLYNLHHPVHQQIRFINTSSASSSSPSPLSSPIRGPPVIHPPSFEDVKRPAQSPQSGRTFTYTMVGVTGILGAVATKSTVINFLSSLSAAGSVLALAQVEVDLSAVPRGKNLVVKWRGKPIFIRHRTQQEIEEANAVPLSELRDPQADSDRVQKPEWLVMLGICTHLGCVPIGESGDFGGCGSHYDISGRVRKGPAPLNMEIPKYAFTDDTKIVIG